MPIVFNDLGLVRVPANDIMREDTSYSSFTVDDYTATSSSYTDFEKIADGSYCILWRARRNGQWYVVKSLQKQYEDSPEYLALLRKEYDILSMFHNPCVVKVFDFCVIDPYGTCIVMEWVDGLTLSQWLDGESPESFPWKSDRCSRRQIALQIIRAVEYVHSLQVVHRDLKPSNIMITRNGCQVKLIDFGLADTDSFTIFKQSAGTEGYISPEQHHLSVTDERNDVYSLGVILREMRLGWPWGGVVRRMLRPFDSRLAHVSDVVPNIRRRRRLATVAVSLCLAVILIVGGLFAWDRLANPRPHYDVVARFQYSNIIYESWGGGKATARLANKSDSTVEVPDVVNYDGFIYKVEEITFNAFRGDGNLRSVIIPGGSHLMKGAFKDCPNLSDIYVRGRQAPVIGNQFWPAKVDDVFDVNHFATVVIHAPRASRKSYAAYPWNRFRHFVFY